MSIHVFVGVGPANLHRALKIQKMDPEAKLVFIDNRLRATTRDIDRTRARANIFRFENDEVTQKLLDDGVDANELKELTYLRDFSVSQGFQQGDNNVFSAKSFTQIQIRDLQLLLLSTLDKSVDNKPLMISNSIDLSNNQSIQDAVFKVLHDNKDDLSIAEDQVQDIKIHIATGALQGDEEKNEIIYPDQAQMQELTATDDVKAMPITALHGTTTFVITDKITCEALKNNQRSLDRTNWAPALKEFGWNLVRPPRVRVFYANDILYIGAEIPFAMDSLSKAAYEEKVTDYTRKIASLVFPDLDINSLPVNPFLRTKFPTSRGERGDAINATHEQTVNWGTKGSTLTANITTSIHGDSRYLPHYQTGSGFVTAFLQNELYADIYSHNNFPELAEWMQSTKAIFENMSADELQKKYEKLTGGDTKLALEACQNELFMAFSREIIEANKVKVGRYFNALHNQELNTLGTRLSGLIEMYNKHQWTNLNIQQFVGIEPKMVVIQLLKENNIAFLREIMPQLLNKDFAQMSDTEVLHMRDTHILDYEHNLDAPEENIASKQEEIKAILKSTPKKEKIEIAARNFDTILAAYNEVHHTDYKKVNFNKAAYAIVVMEMLNRNNNNISFVRQVLPLITDRNITHCTDSEVFEIRDAFTRNYTNVININYSLLIGENNEAGNQLLIDSVLGSNKNFNKLGQALKLPIIHNADDKELLRKRLLNEAVIHTNNKSPFYTSMKALACAEDVANLADNFIAVANAMDSNQEIHHRAAISFFKGKHSDAIHNFSRSMRTLVDKHQDNPEQMKIEAIRLLMKFHSTLEKGHSIRSINALLEAVESIQPKTPSYEASYN